MLRRAAAEPDAFVLGLDANAAAMADASRRTTPAGRRGALPNAIFVASAVEAAPAALAGRASDVSVTFPWGSLLRGVLGCDEAVLTGLAGLLEPGGRLEALVSLAARDAHAAGLDPARLDDLAAIGAAWASAGLCLADVRTATIGQIAASGSSWSKRLRAADGRPIRRLVGFAEP
ncbi:MAG TPA: hypothetical protein VFI28_10670 [Candidatus Limnocylindrales bacterium]|nr:hypothetical protein [Candidatus Limnocylindrales bacterium]